LGSCGRAARLTGLPAGPPQSSAAGEAWRRAKRAPLNSEHYRTTEGLRLAIGSYFRRVCFGLDMRAYLGRAAVECCAGPGRRGAGIPDGRRPARPADPASHVHARAGAAGGGVWRRGIRPSPPHGEPVLKACGLR